jgi:hypothetical protein
MYCPVDAITISAQKSIPVLVSWGIRMGAYNKSCFFRQSALAFAGLPLFIWTMSNLWERSLLRNSLSVMTILAFFQIMGLFFWSRANSTAVRDLKMGRVAKFHKIVGYTCVTIMLLHPAFLVVPRFFESGVAPKNHDPKNETYRSWKES